MLRASASSRRPALTRGFVVVGLLFLVIGFAATSDSLQTSLVDDARLANADQDHENWLTNGRTYKEQRHSPLTQIDQETIGRLGLAWYADMGTIRGLEATPLVVDGVIYVTGAWSKLY